VRVKCLAQEQNTKSPVRARSRIAQSREERTNHEATVPPPCTSRLARRKPCNVVYEQMLVYTIIDPRNYAQQDLPCNAFEWHHLNI